MNARLLVSLACVTLWAGCTRPAKSIAGTFPVGSHAAPWILQNAVWTGSFAQATPALGDDAENWQLFQPARVWLAVYHHDTSPNKRITVRAFAFDQPADARAAFENFRPQDAEPFAAGDEGCWTDIGVLFRWSRMVFDIFGNDASEASRYQSVYLTAFIEKRMPTHLPDAPQ